MREEIHSQCRSCLWQLKQYGRIVSRQTGPRRLLSTGIETSRPRKIFSGIQPTGVPHLGNYFGALRQWVRLQETEDASTRLLYSLVDLHAITVKQDPRQLKQWRKESLATLLAIGLDPSRSTIFFQSDVPAHSELMWILSCTASVGRLSHMTQWKSKLNLPDNAKPLDVPLQLGLFTYPVLQAADILVHSTTHVPVGDDQAQHLEFARACAAAFNHTYAPSSNDTTSPPILIEPATLLSPARRVMSLTHPAKKMSKSDHNPKSRILLTDPRDVIHRKIRAAVTDSHDGVTYDRAARPAIANLVDLIVHLLPPDHASAGQDVDVEAAARAIVSDVVSKAALKDRLTDVVDAHLAPIRERFHELMAHEADYLVDVADEGGELARASAETTLRRVREAVGFGAI